jgi:phospholipid/cholesterol/gamma-HCH transport system substrate-binding protein
VKATSAVRELWVGVLLAVAFVVFFVLLISVGEQHNLLAPKNEYHARFKQTQGLQVGAPVWLEGVPVGSVTGIRFPEDPDDFSIVVTFRVERALASRIRQDTTAVILTQGLIGEALLGLERGSPTAPPAEADSFVPTRESGTLAQFQTQGQIIADNIISIARDIRKVFARLEKGEGLVSKLLVDKQFADNFVERLESATEALAEIAESLNKGESFLGRLMASEDPDGVAAAESVFATIGRVERLVGRVERGEGTIGKLLAEDSEYDQMADGLREMTDAVRNFVRKVEEGEGLVAQLLLDEEAGREILDDMRRASRHIANISEELDRGEGTLGALLEDPSLYEAMEDLVEGIEKSRVLRWFVKRKQAEGAEKDLEEPEPVYTEEDPQDGVSRRKKAGSK